jgi:hypothetical protein
MGFSEARLVKTLTTTAFSSYGIAVTAYRRFFQRCGTPQVDHPSAFQLFFQSMAQNSRIYTTGNGSKNVQV